MDGVPANRGGETKLELGLRERVPTGVLCPEAREFGREPAREPWRETGVPREPGADETEEDDLRELFCLSTGLSSAHARAWAYSAWTEARRGSVLAQESQCACAACTSLSAMAGPAPEGEGEVVYSDS